MVRLISAIFIFTVACVGHAHMVTYHWQALVIEKACFITIRSGVDFLENDRYEDARDINVDLSFSTPHPGTENIYAHLSGVKPAPVVIIAQVHPDFFIRNNGLTVSDVVAVSGGKEYPMILDVNGTNGGSSAYVLGGEAARTIWSNTQDSRSLSISMVVGGTEQPTIDFPLKNFGVAQAMNAACVKQVAEHGLD
jgi:hypothetical protein